ncbi:hypothetical protein [Salinigranum rubrum]|uniref:hypothetical protein n=1 Tax=Salinigranum rubrum TaxID=755307 RepID=UPI0013A5955D|nr:hypothetical protein [Salinigranum rubrum]
MVATERTVSNSRTPASRNGNAASSGVPGGAGRPVGTAPAMPPSLSKTRTLDTPSSSTSDAGAAYHHGGRMVRGSSPAAASA